MVAVGTSHRLAVLADVEGVVAMVSIDHSGSSSSKVLQFRFTAVVVVVRYFSSDTLRFPPLS